MKGNIHEIPRSMRCKNRGKKYASKKIITQDNIYVVRQFAYVHGVIRISLLSRKNTKCDSTGFLSQKYHETGISKITVFLSCAQFFYQASTP